MITGLMIASGSKVVGVPRDERDKWLSMKRDGCLNNATNLKHFCGNILRGMVMMIQVYMSRTKLLDYTIYGI